jgi:hypothetical protein
MNPNLIGLIALVIVLVAIGLGIAGHMTAAWILIALNAVLLIWSRTRFKN